ncbi:hypothetical protein EPN52_07595 [bacterium]|nr:MAG: hypothetical protein EPN52_07595 [bacterium]
MSRYLRAGLVALSLVPLGFFAKRFCWLDFVDVTYHGLLWLHEHMIAVFVVYGGLLVVAALLRVARVQGALLSIEELCSEPPAEVSAAFARAGERLESRPVAVIYVDVPAIFCFAIPGRRIVFSRGMLDALDATELDLVARHEVAHARRGDAIRALLWHLLFAGLVVPGFDALENALYRRRERYADAIARILDPPAYDALTARFQRAGLCSTAPVAAFQVARIPARKLSSAFASVTPFALVLLVALSHVAVVTHLAYLQIHHC